MFYEDRFIDAGKRNYAAVEINFVEGYVRFLDLSKEGDERELAYWDKQEFAEDCTLLDTLICEGHSVGASFLYTDTIK